MISGIRLQLSTPFILPLGNVSASTAVNGALIVLVATVVVYVLLSEVVRARARLECQISMDQEAFLLLATLRSSNLILRKNYAAGLTNMAESARS
jgi:hypothetical protein